MSDLPIGVTPTGDLVMMKRCDECHLADDLHQHGCSLSGIPTEITEICEDWGDDCICLPLSDAARPPGVAVVRLDPPDARWLEQCLRLTPYGYETGHSDGPITETPGAIGRILAALRVAR